MGNTESDDTTIDRRIAQRLKSLRAERGWSLDQLAGRSAVSLRSAGGSGHDGLGGFGAMWRVLAAAAPREAVAAARERWRTYKGAGHDLSYWKQDERGRWEKAG